MGRHDPDRTIPTIRLIALPAGASLLAMLCFFHLAPEKHREQARSYDEGKDADPTRVWNRPQDVLPENLIQTL
jgi:hypothetical protein